METFDETLRAVMDGLKNGTIPHLSRQIRCLNPAHDDYARRSLKRWTSFVQPAGIYVVSMVPEHIIYVSSGGDMAVPMRSYKGHDEVRSFLPVKNGKIGDSHIMGLQSLLVRAAA